MPRALLLNNPQSNQGGADLRPVLDCLRAEGFDLIHEQPDKPGQMPDLIRRYQDQVDCLIVGGGDGSLNCVSQAVMESGLPLGILPLGTANDLARTLLIPDDLEAACRVIARGRPHAIDLGRVNEVTFFNVASIGLGVRVAHELSPEVKRRWGVLSYPKALLRAVQRHRPFRADIFCDGRKHKVHSLQIAVGNGRHYGGGMIVAERAAIDDHLFDLYSIRGLRWWELLTVVPALRSGRYADRRKVLLLQGREIEIRTRKPMWVDTDGEVTTRTPARFTLLADAIRVYVPEHYLSEPDMSEPDGEVNHVAG